MPGGIAMLLQHHVDAGVTPEAVRDQMLADWPDLGPITVMPPSDMDDEDGAVAQFSLECGNAIIIVTTMDSQQQFVTGGGDLGGTMRLGAQTSDVQPGTLAHQIYGDTVTERHRHRYEANTKYLDKLREAGLVISALTQREHLTEIIELPQSEHPWFIGVQFHPEFKSTPWAGHPLFNAFIRAAMQRHGQTA